jgi:hypothetical protein
MVDAANVVAIVLSQAQSAGTGQAQSCVGDFGLKSDTSQEPVVTTVHTRHVDFVLQMRTLWNATFK